MCIDVPPLPAKKSKLRRDHIDDSGGAKEIVCEMMTMDDLKRLRGEL
jgi:hypothetical protein